MSRGYELHTYEQLVHVHARVHVHAHVHVCHDTVTSGLSVSTSFNVIRKVVVAVGERVGVSVYVRGSGE